MRARHSVYLPFALVVCGLLAFGLLIFSSAALGLLAREGGASFSSVASSQLILGLGGGTVLLLFFTFFDYRKLRAVAPYFFAFAFGLTLLTFVPGVGLTLKGASRWIEIGSFTFQPEEILKFATVLFVAALYAARFKTMQTFQSAFIPLLAVAAAMGVLILQPSYDGALVIGLASGGILFAAGARFRHFAVLGVAAALLLSLALWQQPYIVERIETFFNYSADPLGAGWQIRQTLQAIGSGEWFGRGFGQSVEKFSYLPEPMGDSVFAVAGEEFGFIGSALLVSLFAAFAVLGLRIASRAKDPFGGLIVVGLVVVIVAQSFWNIASTLGLVPFSGLPLIFVSHGGTALALALAEVGVMLSVSRHMRK